MTGFTDRIARVQRGLERNGRRLTALQTLQAKLPFDPPGIDFLTFWMQESNKKAVAARLYDGEGRWMWCVSGRNPGSGSWQDFLLALTTDDTPIAYRVADDRVVTDLMTGDER